MIETGFEFGLGVLILLVVAVSVSTLGALLAALVLKIGKRIICLLKGHDFPEWRDGNRCYRCNGWRRCFDVVG